MTDDPAPPRATDRLRSGVGLLLLALASLAWPGYRFGGSNQSIQVPLLRWSIDPSQYRFDLLRDSFAGFASWFFALLAPLVRASGDVEAVYFFVYAAVLTASLAAVRATALRLGGRPPAGFVACLFFLSQYPSLAGESTHWNGLTHAEAAAALLLWAIWLHLGGRLSAALALAGLAFNLHALFALYLAFLLLADALLARPRAWRSALAATAAFLLLAGPTLYWLLAHGGGTPEPLDAWLAILRERSAHHAFPLSVPAAVYARYGLLLALGAHAVAERPGERGRFVRWGVGMAALAVLGVVFAEWLPVPALIRAQLLRSSKWLTYLLLFPLAELAIAAWSRGALGRIVSVALVLGVLLREPFGLALALALLLVEDPARRGVLLTAAGGLALSLAGATGAVPVPDQLGLRELGGVVQRLLQPEAVTALALLGALRAVPPQRARAAGLAVLALVLLVLLPASEARWRAAVHAEPWTRVQLWVRAATPADAVLLTPPYMDGFRVFSERSIAGEWKDGTQQFFDAGFGFRWRERMRLLGDDTRRYDGFSDQRLRELARHFGARYAVVRADRETALPRLHVEPPWAVLELSRP